MQSHIIQVLTTNCLQSIFVQIVHILCGYNDLVFADVGIDIAHVQQIVLVELLFRHSHDAPHGLNRKLLAIQLSEYQQNGSPWAVPSQGYGLLEQQHFGHAVWLLQSVKVLFLFRQPHGQTLVLGGDALDGAQIGLHLLGNRRVIGGHGFACVVGQLYQQQRIDVGIAFLAVCLGYLPAFLQSTLYQVLVQLALVGVALGDVGVEHHLPLYHLFGHHLFAAHGHYVV